MAIIGEPAHAIRIEFYRDSFSACMFVRTDLALRDVQSAATVQLPCSFFQLSGLTPQFLQHSGHVDLVLFDRFLATVARART